MNPSSYRLSKEVLQDMLDDDYKKKFHKYDSMFGDEVQGPSPADVSQQHLDDFYNKNSGVLKKMQAAFLTNATKNCYPEKHLSDSFTNYEQIVLCKE